MSVRFYTAADSFLEAATPVFERDPVAHTVIASNAQRFVGAELPSWAWFAVIRVEQAEHLVMRTHPAEPHAGFCPALPVAAHEALLAALAERGEVVPAWNGDLETALALCQAVAGPDDQPRVTMHTRLFELGSVVWPSRPEGELRPATQADLDLCLAWEDQFWRDAALQAGRLVSSRGPSPEEAQVRRDVYLQRVDDGLLWLWQVDGTPVHMTGLTPSSHGVRRLGPVFTPAEYRGMGYAAWVVAALSQRILDEGERPCLYTDQANPVSNKVYERVGYMRVADEGNVELHRRAQAGGRLEPEAEAHR